MSFTLDYNSNSNSETKMSRKFSLYEKIEFCQMSSDEKRDFDENVSKQEADSELHKTLYGEPNNKIFQNEDEALTSEDEQSDDGDKEANEPV